MKLRRFFPVNFIIYMVSGYHVFCFFVWIISATRNTWIFLEGNHIPRIKSINTRYSNNPLCDKLLSDNSVFRR